MKCTVLTMISMVVGCSATGYHPANSFGGYQDTRIADDTFRVEFNGNGLTSTMRAADFGMLRASELCLDYDYPFYAVVKQDDHLHVEISGSRSGITTTERPSTTLLVKCLEEKPDTTSALVVDANMMRREIRAKYQITE